MFLQNLHLSLKTPLPARIVIPLNQHVIRRFYVTVCANWILYNSQILFRRVKENLIGMLFRVFAANLRRAVRRTVIKNANNEAEIRFLFQQRIQTLCDVRLVVVCNDINR